MGTGVQFCPRCWGDRLAILTPPRLVQNALIRARRERGRAGMLTVETIGRVRREFHVKGKKIKAIARELRVSRNTVRRIVRGDETVHRYARKEQPLPQLGTHVAGLEEMLAGSAGKPQRERLTFMRMFEELRLSGYTGGYD